MRGGFTYDLGLNKNKQGEAWMPFTLGRLTAFPSVHMYASLYQHVLEASTRFLCPLLQESGCLASCFSPGIRLRQTID